jgi:acetyl esterase
MRAMSRLSPQMAALLHRIHRVKRPAFHELSVAEARSLYDASAEVLDLPRVPLAEVRELSWLLPHGQRCAARLYRPSLTEPLPVVLYLHGGGFTVGSLETHDSLCRQLAWRSGAAVLALDYRLAPEHRFPAAVEDSHAALLGLAQHAGVWGLDATRMAVAGDSAGGTLAAVAALMAAGHGGPFTHGADATAQAALAQALRAQLLITPGTTAHADTASHREFAQGYLLDADSIAWFFNHYIDAPQREDWRFAPLLAPELEGAAPALVLLAECDPLVDEGLAYADRLRWAGVPVQLEQVRGVTHDFIKMGRALPQAIEALDAAAGFLRQHLFERP